MNRANLLLHYSFIFTLKALHFIVLFFKKILGTKTVLFVSKQKIKSYSVGPFTQIALISFLLWIGDLFIKSIRYNAIIQNKSQQIAHLKNTNKQFELEFESLNSNLKKISYYFSTISGYKNVADAKSKNYVDEKIKDIFGNTKLIKQDEKTAFKIADSKLVLEDIKNSTIKRISDLKQKIAISDLVFSDNKILLKKFSKTKAKTKDAQPNIISLNSNSEVIKGQGGPFQQLKQNINSANNFNLDTQSSNNIKNEIDYLANLEKFIRQAPFTPPMKNYYVSSSFGERSDPIRGAPAKHNGMDFVGKIGEKVLSPSAGKVIFTGKYGSYGNAIIIDHGYGITTRYGHLKNIKVKKGDKVYQNQAIARQGNTGRSTGSHLHYEVRYKNIPMNPKKFLQAGQKIFSSNQSNFNNVEI
jgi:murein DD-endopeptidase MepM/ murein hydrolase activator NlpD